MAYTRRRQSSLALLAILILAVLGTLIQPISASEDVEEPPQTEEETFLFACSGGQEDDVMKMLEAKPELAKAITEDGETCLHLTAISGSVPIAKAAIAAGCDVNARATCKDCLRMTPLSWLTYGGKYELVEVLLKAGADINMTFDGFEEGQLFTVMDVAKRFADARKAGDDGEEDPFVKTLDILKAHGGKMFEDLGEL